MEDGKGNNSEVDHAFCLEARLRTSKIVLRPIFLPLRFPPSLPLSLLSSILGRSSSPPSLLVLSSSLLSLSLSPCYIPLALHLSSSLPISFPQRRVDACVRTQARKVLLSPTLMHVQRRASDLVSLSLCFSHSASASFALLSSHSLLSSSLI